MKFLLKTLLAALLSIVASGSFAHDFAVDGIYYVITSNKDKTVAVTCYGHINYDVYYYKYESDVNIPQTVTYNSTTYNVTSITQNAFFRSPALTSVIIPESVTSIGDAAFYLCSGLTSLTIPESVTSIGEKAFSGCSGLTSIVVQKNNTKYDSRNGSNAIIETSTNTLIAGCRNTVIPESVTSIGDWAFYGCSGLTSVTIPESVILIGGSAFCKCTGLTSVTIPEGVTSIGSSAFSGCSGLTSVTIPNSVISIGELAFCGCI